MVILHENKVHYMIYQKYFLVKWCSHKWNIITSLTEKYNYFLFHAKCSVFNVVLFLQLRTVKYRIVP